MVRRYVDALGHQWVGYGPEQGDLMPRATSYPPANRTAQWCAGKYPGDVMQLAAPVLVLHTTEGGSWPTYDGGAMAPTLTYWRGHGWRQHFPVNMSSRALKNAAGGVETNTAGAIQLELVGTCAKGGPGFYWPGATDAELGEVAEFVAWLHLEWGLPITDGGLEWVAYPQSYGVHAPQRMSFAQWRGFSGVCGHQHVPENDHGDPGAFPAGRLLRLAQQLVNPKPVTPAKPVPTSEETLMAALSTDDVIEKIAQRAADLVWAEAIPVDQATQDAYGYGSAQYAAASLLRGGDAQGRGARQDIAALRAEVAALRAELKAAKP